MRIEKEKKKEIGAYVHASFSKAWGAREQKGTH